MKKKVLIMRNHFALIVLLFLSTFSGTGQAQTSGVQWETNLDAALARAKSENKPLLLSMHTSTEIACKRMLGNLYSDVDVIAKLKDFVVLPTCFDRHAEVKKSIDGEEKMVSPMFRTIDCETLMRNEHAVKEMFFEKAEVKVPNHIFVGIDGAIFMKKIYELKKPAFLDLLDRALVQFGSKTVDGMDGATQELFRKVKKGNVKEKEAAVKAILEFQNAEKTETLYRTIQGLKKDEDRAVCIRAMGSDDLTDASPIAMKWMSDKSDFIKNCAVVTLEEMKAGDATKSLLDLFDRTKKNSKELRKDILRALGPCGFGDPAAKQLLMTHATDKKEPMRLAAYMSLGHFLDEEDVQQLLQKRFKKDSKGVAARTAILFAYLTSKDTSLIPQVDAMTAGEKNHQILMVAGAAKRAMGGETDGAKSKKVSGKSMRKAWAPLYTKDKIVRNRIKRWRR
ncbi:MAG: hypothetical protein ACI97A_003040 [Planctomycetota bacterium]